MPEDKAIPLWAKQFHQPEVASYWLVAMTRVEDGMKAFTGGYQIRVVKPIEPVSYVLLSW